MKETDNPAAHFLSEQAESLEALAGKIRIELARMQGRTKRSAEAREMRNREIMALARRGWTNKEIGARFNLHPVSISRIIQRQLKGSR